jgi:hypothetical protein
LKSSDQQPKKGEIKINNQDLLSVQDKPSRTYQQAQTTDLQWEKISMLPFSRNPTQPDYDHVIPSDTLKRRPKEAAKEAHSK